MKTWVIDKSALVRLGTSPDVAEWAERVQRGLVHIASVTLLEVGFSARSGAGLREDQRRPPLAWLPVEFLTPTMEQRALDVQLLLADRGLHRGPGTPDLLVAATAERAGRTVLHHDKDFDLIAEVTGQPVERLRTP